MNGYTRLGSDPLTAPVYAIVSTLSLICLWKHYVECCTIRLDGCLMDTCLLHDTVHRGKMFGVSPHAVNENEQVDIVVGHGN